MLLSGDATQEIFHKLCNECMVNNYHSSNGLNRSTFIKIIDTLLTLLRIIYQS